MTARLNPTTLSTPYTAPCPEPCGVEATWHHESYSPSGLPPFTDTYRIHHEGECKAMPEETNQ